MVHDTRLIARSPLTARVVSMVFESHGSNLTWLPGQHVVFEVQKDDVTETKYFSIASAFDPATPGRFELAVAMESESKIPFHSLPLGTSIRMSDPRGTFTRAADDPRATVLVGVGTGIAPLRAMVQAELRSSGRASLVLLAGFRSDEEILFRDEFESLAANHPRFTFLTTLSRAPEQWSGRVGYVQDHLEHTLTLLDRPAFFVCGDSNMVSTVGALLAKHRARIDSVSAESYG